MRSRLFGLGAGLLLLANGCATGPIPGGAGDVSGPLRSIELYTNRPQGEAYPTASRRRLFASDGELWIRSHWTLSGPGVYTSTVTVRTPAGVVHGEEVFTFRAEDPNVATMQRIGLPRGEAAHPLAGRWEVEVSLDARPLGRRAFTFDPSNIRLRAEARLLIVRGKYDLEALSASSGDWFWQDRVGAMESASAALALLGAALRDELSRRFPKVDGPLPSAEGTDAAVLLTPRLLLSPNADVDPRLELDAVHVPTKTARTFRVDTVAGQERSARGGGLLFAVAAVDLAFQAASSPELLEFLMSSTQAAPE